MAYLYQLYISYKISYRTPREASYRLPIEYLMTYVICSGFMKGTLTSWALGFSHITRPFNGLGFMEGILQCWAQYFFSNQSSYGIGLCLSSYPGIGFAPCSTLNFSYKALTKWVGRYKGNSPMSLAAHLLHRVQLILLMFYGVEVHELPLLKSIVYLLYFLDFTFFPLCMVFLAVKYLTHERCNYRLLSVFLYFLT